MKSEIESIQDIMEKRKELKRRLAINKTRQWAAKNPEYKKMIDNLRSKRWNLNRAIPKLEKKLERYRLELIQVEKDIAEKSRGYKWHKNRGKNA